MLNAALYFGAKLCDFYEHRTEVHVPRSLSDHRAATTRIMPCPYPLPPGVYVRMIGWVGSSR